VVHANAPLSELGRLRLARCIVEDGWPISRAAERIQVSRTTAIRWAGRYRQSGAGGVRDRSSRPAHSPNRTRPSTTYRARRPTTDQPHQRLGAEQLALGVLRGPRGAW
jgi:transposase-like protein